MHRLLSWGFAPGYDASALWADGVKRRTSGLSVFFARSGQKTAHPTAFAVVGLVMALTLSVAADTHYVSMPGGYGTNDTAGGYTNWEGAATQIQWAVTAAVDGDTVLVTNGTYYLTNQIVLTNSITLQSVNGPGFTFINGNYPAYSNRCLFWSNKTATVSGFTMSNGYIVAGYAGGGNAYAGGVYMYGGTLTNCHICNNYGQYGGGIQMMDYPVGQRTSYILNCIINSNRGEYFGGASYAQNTGGGTAGYIKNCVISYNTATTAGYPGGVNQSAEHIYNSEISYNTGPIGGIKAGWYGAIYECKIIGNSGTTCGGVSITIGYLSNLRNCLIRNNRATTGAGGVALTGNAYGGPQYMRNLTIVSNSTDSSDNAGGIYFYNTTGKTTNALYNSIVYFNSSGGTYSNVYNNGFTNIIVSNCCIGMTNGALGPATQINNVIYTDPLLIDLPAANCRLSSSSPCINAGYYESWMTTTLDLDDRIRLRYGIVDLGAYEFIRSGTLYGFH
ncbi:MAG: hypothetical protein KJ692_05605 [Verrucomicrobia bacterium]|nr:hypothetical protein [Verrucomicrobiota bacterium]